MAKLSELPNEIILLILPLLLPDYIESFSAACKKHYILAAEELNRHRASKREHAVYKFRNFRHRGVSRLLDMILQEPRIALYVREITLNGWSSQWRTHVGLNAELSSRLENAEFSSRLENAVSELVPEEKRRGWMAEIRYGNEDPIVSLVLLLLPNLSKLRFEGFGSKRGMLRHTLDRIARTNSLAAPLSLLRHVDLICAWDVGGARILRNFIALPSIRSIHVEQINEFVSYSEPSITELAPLASKLEELTLIDCRISSDSLNYILKRLRTLRSFTFEAKRYLDFESTQFRAALFDVGGSTIESLTLLTRNEKRNVIGDIRTFQSLRNLHTETQLLLDYFPNHFDESSLAKALPPNLQTLTLECSGKGDDFVIAEYISTLAEMKNNLVPQLKEVEVCTRNGIRDFNEPPDSAPFAITEGHSYEALVKACHAQGFKFRVTELKETGWYRSLYYHLRHTHGQQSSQGSGRIRDMEKCTAIPAGLVITLHTASYQIIQRNKPKRPNAEGYHHMSTTSASWIWPVSLPCQLHPRLAKQFQNAQGQKT
ncbi:hypothetical protein BDR22DRAFT_964758 [Usnea florida]